MCNASIRARLVGHLFVRLAAFQLAFALCSVGAARAQVIGAERLDDATVRRIVEAAAKAMNDDYVFEDIGQECAALLAKNLADGAYAEAKEPAQLADRLTRDLRQVAKDLHFEVIFDPKPAAEPSGGDERARERQVEDMRRTNYGFEEVKRLDGNIGYLDLRGFVPAAFGGPTAVAAMGFLANSDALIIDLRRNTGGSPEMIQLITSYFFESRPIHLNSFAWRGKAEIDQTWTLPHVPGKRLPTTPLYILTSRDTFSAAEEFAYNLKNLKRAVIVGESTGGGAHPCRFHPLIRGFGIFVPRGRAINPITKSNWEGIGVEPDIKVAATDALNAARREALSAILKSTKDADDRRAIESLLKSLGTEAKPGAVSAEVMTRLVGQYGTRRIFVENGELMQQREGRRKFRLLPVGENLYRLDDTPDDLRFSFAFEGDRAVRMTVTSTNGDVETLDRK